RGEELARRQGVPVYRVQAFREKPALELAEQLVAGGECYWNSGIFVWKAAKILSELRKHKPELAAAVERIAAAWDTPRRAAILAADRREEATVKQLVEWLKQKGLDKYL